MSTSAITNALFSQIAGSASTANRFATDLNQVSEDLQNGNLSSAQQDYVTLSQDALNGATASSADTSASGISTSLLSTLASSSSAESSFVSELNQLGTDLAGGGLTSAQGDLLKLDSLALSNASPGSANAAASVNSAADSKALIQSFVQALEVGDSSLAGSALTQLASLSPSSSGASLLSQAGSDYSAGSSSSSGSTSIAQLFQTPDSNSTSSTSSIVSLFA